MKFKIKNTKTTLVINTMAVAKQHAIRPEKYEPVDDEAKRLVAKLTGEDEKEPKAPKGAKGAKNGVTENGTDSGDK